jgi:hypothetical protein
MTAFSAEHPMHPHRRHLSFGQMLISLASWIMAGAVFLTLGWSAMKPEDPEAAVSLLAHADPWVMFGKVLALAAATSAVCTLLAGRFLRDVGVFATTVALAVVSVQGGTTSSFLWAQTTGGTPETWALAVLFVLEAVAWWAMILVCLCVTAWVARWVSEGSHEVEGSEGIAAGDNERLWAAHDLPKVGALLASKSSIHPTPLIGGLKHAALAAGVAIAFAALLSTGLQTRVIRHGQACFVVAAAVWLGTTLAHRNLPVRSSLWSIVGVLVFAGTAFLWSAFQGPTEGSPVGIPPSHFLRVLPIQYVCVGTAVAIATSWYAHAPAGSERRRGDVNA